MKALYLLACGTFGILGVAVAQPPNPPPFTTLPYGISISIADARAVAAVAVDEARKKGLSPTVAVVDPSGSLLYYEKDNRATYAAEDLAILGAKGAARFGHGGDSWQHQMEAGDLSILFLPGPVYQTGGSQVLVRDKKIVGAIGVSAGAGSKTDAEISKLAALALKP